MSSTEVAIAGALVSVDSGGLSATTSATGEYTIKHCSTAPECLDGYRDQLPIQRRSRIRQYRHCSQQDFYLAQTAPRMGGFTVLFTSALNSTVLLSGVRISSTTGESTTTDDNGHYFDLSPRRYPRPDRE